MTTTQRLGDTIELPAGASVCQDGWRPAIYKTIQGHALALRLVVGGQTTQNVLFAQYPATMEGLGDMTRASLLLDAVSHFINMGGHTAEVQHVADFVRHLYPIKAATAGTLMYVDSECHVTAYYHQADPGLPAWANPHRVVTEVNYGEFSQELTEEEALDRIETDFPPDPVDEGMPLQRLLQ